MDLVPIFLGAHAVPVEYKNDPEGYFRQVVEKMLPAVASSGLAVFCDVFCEEGAFSVEQSRTFLFAAKAKGLKPKIHADEIVSLGGGELVRRSALCLRTT